MSNMNYFPKENDSLNYNEYIKCYKDPEGYYLDNNIYKPCYYTCKTCNISGNDIFHNCLECNANNHFEIKFNNYSNCYNNCSYYYYFDKENNKYYCTLNSSCPNEYPKLNKDKLECVKYNIENILDDLSIKEKNETEKMTKEEEIEYYDNLLDILEEGFTDNFDTSNIDEGQDEVIKTEKVTVTFTSVENQKNDINQNVTTIDLGDCENELRKYYNLSNNETLYMKKIDVIQEGFNIPKVEYDVYSKLYGTNLIKLNLSVCENSKIIISIPINLIENIDIFNSSSGYYNDICYTTTSEDGTDITLNDRKSNYIDKNMSICQDGCEFSLYDKKKQKAGCSCNVKESSSTIADMKINKDKLIKNFKDIKNIINLNILVCYKNLLKKESIIYNVGCYILLSIIIFHIISIFVFYLSEFNLIKNKIKKIIFGINEEQIINKNEILKENKSRYNSNDISIYKKKKKKKSNKKKHNKNKNIKIIDDYSKRKMISINNYNKNEKINNNDIEKIENILEYIDEEINDLSYNLALQYDQRIFCQYYISLIKTKHSLIFAFFNNNDYNSKIIKIDLFLIGFGIDYIVNALFYNDDTMHKIYQSKGEFDFEAQIPIIIYSTLISMVLNTPLNILALSNDAIIDFKQEKSKMSIMKKTKELENKLSIKFIIYYIISFLFLSFFLYYISMFCVIYKNTQIHLLKDTLLSFGLSLFLPFLYNLLPGIFRTAALYDRKDKREYLYNFSKFLQSF